MSLAQRLDGKVAVVTGGASGIGEAVVRQFVDEGGRVIIADVQAEQGEALARQLGNAIFVRTDVNSEAAIARAIDLAVERYGRFDSMVNNAGFIGAVGSIAETPHKYWQATLSVLLDAVFFGMKHAAKRLREQGTGGTILTTTSVAGLRGGFGAHAYTTAKHAVIGLTRSVAAELAADRIRVNAVAPGNVLSPLSMALIGTDAETADSLAAQASPLGLAMYPRDIAHAFAYLASDGAMHVTGQVITVDAGATMAPEAPAFHKIDPAFMGPAGLVAD